MAFKVRHRPIDPAKGYFLHAWDGKSAWDLPGNRSGTLVAFDVPDVDDPRALRFKYRSADPATHQETWEGDEFVRRIRLAAPSEVWTFEQTARVVYNEPTPKGVGSL
jgi:hypothetical protein